MTATTINGIHVSCRNCCFAVRESETQVGCKLGRLEKFREQGCVVDAEDGTGAEFCVINGRMCNAHRLVESDWAHQYAGRELEQVREEIALRLAVFVVVDEVVSEDELVATARSLLAQERPPQETFFVHNGGMKPGRLAAILRRELASHITWRVVGVFPEGDTRPSRPAALDLAIAQAKQSSWYAVFNGGFVVPYSKQGWWETNSGEALTASTGAGSTTGITVVYERVK